MNSRLALAKHITNQDSAGILEVMFEKESLRVRKGFYTEDDLWDYKENLPPREDELQWAGIAADVLGFHNNKGGVLIFGIRDHDFSFAGATHALDSKHFNDKIRRYVQDQFLVGFSREAIQDNQRYLGLAVIPVRRGSVVLSKGTSPFVKGSPRILREGDLCMRVRDETRIRRRAEAFTLRPLRLEEANLDPHNMKLDMPANSKVGNTVWVTWDVKASEDRGVRGLYPEPQQGTITYLDTSLVSVYFVYPEDGEYDGPLEENISIDLENGTDNTYNGTVKSIDRTCPHENESG